MRKGFGQKREKRGKLKRDLENCIQNFISLPIVKKAVDGDYYIITGESLEVQVTIKAHQIYAKNETTISHKKNGKWVSMWTESSRNLTDLVMLINKRLKKE